MPQKWIAWLYQNCRIAWLYRRAQSKDSIHYITLHPFWWTSLRSLTPHSPHMPLVIEHAKKSWEIFKSWDIEKSVCLCNTVSVCHQTRLTIMCMVSVCQRACLMSMSCVPLLPGILLLVHSWNFTLVHANSSPSTSFKGLFVFYSCRVETN